MTENRRPLSGRRQDLGGSSARSRGVVTSGTADRQRPTVTVYTRQSCKLCHAAEAVVGEVAAGRADVVIVDIDTDAALYERYTVRVPVVAVDGDEIAEYHVDAGALRAAIDART